MAYKIAIASSDGKQIDQSFGKTSAFLIYEVDGRCYRLLETRAVPDIDNASHVQDIERSSEDVSGAGDANNARSEGGGMSAECGSGTGCGNGDSEGTGCSAGNNAGGGCGTGTGCGAGGASSPKVDLISDCRCIICQKIGFGITKQLEKKAISSFDIECPVEEALDKIVVYLDKVDRHESLRGISRQ